MVVDRVCLARQATNGHSAALARVILYKLSTVSITYEQANK